MSTQMAAGPSKVQLGNSRSTTALGFRGEATPAKLESRLHVAAEQKVHRALEPKVSDAATRVAALVACCLTVRSCVCVVGGRCLCRTSTARVSRCRRERWRWSARSVYMRHMSVQLLARAAACNVGL